METALKRPVPRIYGIENWGNGYFDVNDSGHFVVRPTRGSAAVDVRNLIEEVKSRGLTPPLLIRFPQILGEQVRALTDAFAHAITEFDYGAAYQGVFPMKVNHRRDVVEELLRVGAKRKLGLEVGSKAELFVGLALEQAPGSLLICNGFKDREFMEMAFWGSRLGKDVVVVAEQIRDIELYLEFARENDRRPLLGLRGKLYARGSGKWEESGGETSKFGLTTMELLTCVRRLEEEGLLDQLAMLHFHIGSQITDIRSIKNAVKEASRVYAKFRKMEAPVRFLNMGGGLGVDYDGSGTSSDSSVNYSIQEFANDVVYTVSEICESEDVPAPILVSESGRALSVYHAMLVMSAENREPNPSDPVPLSKPTESASLKEMIDILRGINVKNYREYYHDALQQREELFTLFDLGYLGLEERAQGEMLFQSICEKALRFSKQAHYVSDEFELLDKALRKKYVANFSVFQSLPDSWTIGHLFPILPVHRLDEFPSEYGMIVDLSCDSDGKVDNFIDVKDIKDVLELHPARDGEPYYLAVCLLGAYQDVMGDFHNLFGAVNEVHVVVDPAGRHRIQKLLRGNTIDEVIGLVGYETEDLVERLQTRARKLVSEGQMEGAESEALVQEFLDRALTSTYLKSQ